MSYQEQKQAWQRRLIESLHGSLEAPVEAGLSEGRGRLRRWSSGAGALLR
jgi:hypothetical protein